jgi:hypothetical protein
MPSAPSEYSDRNAMEHAQLVMNAIARFESLLQPMLEAGPPEARQARSREMIEWLAATPDATLRAALLDRPCPVGFYKRWAPADQITAWLTEASRDCAGPPADPGAVACLRPSEFFQALCAQKKT